MPPPECRTNTTSYSLATASMDDLRASISPCLLGLPSEVMSVLRRAQDMV